MRKCLDKPTVLLVVGGMRTSSLETVLRDAHQAAARDLLARLLQTGMVARAIVAADDAAWAHTLADLPVTVDLDPPGETFHFGRRLADLIERYDVRRALYSGGASAPLMDVNAWEHVLRRLAVAKRLVMTNNVHSCDWLGIAPAGDALPWIAQAASDNALAWQLANQAGFPAEALPASAATRFDLDTPLDLLIAQRHPAIGPHLRAFLDGLGWKAPQLDLILSEMKREGGSLAVAGRVSSEAWRALERGARCWVRVFAEERGMRASGRQERGQVRCLLSDYLDLVGFEEFFQELAGLANGVFFDNRVIMAARGLWPSAADRFNADLYRWGDVEDPFLRRFTRAAAEAQTPILLGGHSVVAGGLMALVESLVVDKLDKLDKEDD